MEQLLDCQFVVYCTIFHKRLDSHHFLTVISQPTRAIKFLQNGDVELSNEDFKLFKELNGRHGEGHLRFKNAMKLFAKKKDDLD
jgi:hypothetical protein